MCTFSGAEDKEEDIIVKMPLLDNYASSPGSNSSFSQQPESAAAPVEEEEDKSEFTLRWTQLL